MSPVVVGVDLGGTKIAAAIVGADGSLGRVVTRATPAASGPRALLDAIAEAVRAAADGHDLAGVGVGSAGSIDATRGVVVSATETLTGWAGTDIAGGLRDRLGGPLVAVLNDVDAHALGEAWRGAAAGVDCALTVAVGTGIGGAVLLGGRPRRGANHLAGEIGHVPTPGAEGLRCGCGRLGHLEGLAAGPAIHRRYLALGGALTVAHTRAVFAAADDGDAIAARVIDDAASGLGRAVAGLVTLLDPDLVVVSGGVAQAGPRWWQPFERALRADLVDALAQVTVRPAALGADAAIVGAARSALDLVAATRLEGAR